MTSQTWRIDVYSKVKQSDEEKDEKSKGWPAAIAAAML